MKNTINTKELFLKLLQAKSITPNDCGLFDFIKEYLSDFNAIRVDKNGIKNLFLYKKFNEGNHLCFAGHIDVVPAGEGWDSDPFIPVVKDGFVYARGSQDMKSGVCAFINACKNAKNFNGTLSLLLTSDEECDALYGTVEVLKYLEKKNFLPDFAIVAEPTCENIFGDTMKIGRRGSINGIVTIKGVQGHAAYPGKFKNPIHLLAPKLPKIAGYFLDSGDDFFEPSQIVITDIRAGCEVTNITPNSLKLMFNVRNSTKTTIEDIETYVKKQLDGLDFELTLHEGSKPFVTNQNSKVVKNLQKIIKEVLGINTKLSTAGGTSDARFFGEYKINTVEFGVVNDKIHAANERCEFSQVVLLEEIFTKIIKEF